MVPNDKQKFVTTLLGFAALKGKALPIEAIDLYWLAMQDWEILEFQKAAVHLLKTCEFMPTPKDFEDLRKSSRATSGEAWAAVLQHVRWGAYRSGKMEDETAHKAVMALGGYQSIAMSEESKLHFLEKRFVEHYESIQDSSEVRRALPALTSPRLLE